MKLKLFYFFTLLLISVIHDLDAAKSMGPIGTLLVTSMYDCPEKEKFTDEKMSYKLELKNGEEGMALFGSGQLQYDLDNSMSYNAELKRFMFGSWKKVTDAKGKVCRDIQKYLPTFWASLTSAIKPKPSSACPLKAGNFTIDNFKATAADIDIPVLFYGKLLLKVTSAYKSGKIWFCTIFEIDSSPPT